MSDWNDPAPGSGVSFWTMMAILVGSLLSLRTVVEASPLARMVSVGGSFALAFFLTPAVAAFWGLAPAGERATGLLLAFVGVNLLAGLAVFGAKFRNSPQAAIEWLFSLWRGGAPK